MVTIDWVDAIQYKNESYRVTSPCIEINPENIGMNIGIIHFTLSGNVGNPHYKMRNFDATFLLKNTELYKVINEPDSIAALVDGIYYKYEKQNK